MFHYLQSAFGVFALTRVRVLPTLQLNLSQGRERPVRTGQAGSSPHGLSQHHGLRVLRAAAADIG